MVEALVKRCFTLLLNKILHKMFCRILNRICYSFTEYSIEYYTEYSIE